MNKLTKTAATVATSVSLALGMAGMAAADATSNNNCSSTNLGTSSVVCDSNSTDHSININGDCSAYIKLNNDQSNENSTDQVGANSGTSPGIGLLYDSIDLPPPPASDNSVNQNNSNVQSNSNSFTFSPNCGTTNVTNVTQQAAGGRGGAELANSGTTLSAGGLGAGADQQVSVTPVGGVGAGAGAGVSKNTAGAVAGLTGSIASIGAGFGLRKKVLGL